MYTYESFETLGTFTLLRPIFVVLLLATLLMFLVVVIPKFREKWLNRFTVLSISVLLIFVSGQLLFYSTIIVDELGLGGDAVATYLFLLIGCFSVVNPVVYFYVSK